MKIRVIPESVLSLPIGDARLKLAVEIALKTALRRNEVLSLDINQVADGQSEVYVKVKGRKRWEWVHLRPSLKRAIRAFIGAKRDGPLLVGARGGRLSASALNDLWRKHQERAGVSPRFRFHDLRHTAITNFYDETGDIYETCAFARHRNITITALYIHANPARIYRHMDDMDMQAASIHSNERRVA